MNKSLLTLITLISLSLILSNKVLAQEINDSISYPTLNQKTKSEAFNKGLIVDPLQLIQGISPGASISKKGSDPNVFNSVSYRGNSTYYSGGVLYVIDGVIGASPNLISPEDIESFEILKDAVSIARYGSKGMEGVVVIKTKRNKTDKKLSVDFNSYLSLNQTSKRMDLLSASQLRSFIEKNELNFEDGGESTDWQDEIFRNTVAQNYSIAVQGRLDNTGYRVSLNYQNNPGIVLGSNRSNTGLSLNVNHSALNNRLNLNFSSSISTPNGKTIPYYYGTNGSNIFYQAFTHNPTDPIYESDGVSYAQSIRAFEYYNPLPIIEYIKNTYSSRNMNLSLGAEYKIFKGLNINVNAGYSFNDNQRAIDEDLYLAYYWYNEADKSFTEEINDKETLNLEYALKYNISLSDKHHFEVQAVFQHHSTFFEEKSSNLEFFDSEFSPISSSRYFEQTRNINSFIGKIDYNFKNRYFVSAIVNNEFYKYQSEYYNIFGENYTGDMGNPFKTSNLFYGINLGWSIHNESFMKGLTLINKLELIGSYGIFGNTYPYEATYFSSTQDINDLDVEKTAEYSLGLNFGLWEKRINGSIIYYDRKLNDGILQFSVPVPPYQYPFVYKNGLVLKNQGLEFSLNTTPFENEKIKWSSDLYFHSNSNIFPDEGLNSSLHNKTEYFNYYGIQYPLKIKKEGSPFPSFYPPFMLGKPMMEEYFTITLRET